jgi:hypothetical protein
VWRVTCSCPRLVLNEGRASLSSSVPALDGESLPEGTVAWHPDDEEQWFKNRQACLTAAERATLSMDREPEAHPAGGVHIDCLGEP